jgi:hypothetical protein
MQSDAIFNNAIQISPFDVAPNHSQLYDPTQFYGRRQMCFPYFHKSVTHNIIVATIIIYTSTHLLYCIIISFDEFEKHFCVVSRHKYAPTIRHPPHSKVIIKSSWSTISLLFLRRNHVKQSGCVVVAR